MLGENFYFFNLIEKYNIVFSKLFADIHVVRKDTIDIKVPITYISKQKMGLIVDRESGSPTTNNMVSVVLPALSYKITSISYDESRQKNKTNQLVLTDIADGKVIYSRDGIPYNIEYEVTSWCKTQEDLFQIFEQITTFFQPEYCISMKIFSEANMSKDIVVLMNSTNVEFIDMDESTPEVSKYQFTLGFTLKGWLFAPIKDAVVIEKIKMKTYLNEIEFEDTRDLSKIDLY